MWQWIQISGQTLVSYCLSLEVSTVADMADEAASVWAGGDVAGVADIVGMTSGVSIGEGETMSDLGDSVRLGLTLSKVSVSISAVGGGDSSVTSHSGADSRDSRVDSGNHRMTIGRNHSRVDSRDSSSHRVNSVDSRNDRVNPGDSSHGVNSVDSRNHRVTVGRNHTSAIDSVVEQRISLSLSLSLWLSLSLTLAISVVDGGNTNSVSSQSGADSRDSSSNRVDSGDSSHGVHSRNHRVTIGGNHSRVNSRDSSSHRVNSRDSSSHRVNSRNSSHGVHSWNHRVNSVDSRNHRVNSSDSRNHRVTVDTGAIDSIVEEGISLSLSLWLSLSLTLAIVAIVVAIVVASVVVARNDATVP